jgi:hypothetical protein
MDYEIIAAILASFIRAVARLSRGASDMVTSIARNLPRLAAVSASNPARPTTHTGPVIVIARDRAVPAEARKFARAIARNYWLFGRKAWLVDMTIEFERGQLSITDSTTINFLPAFYSSDPIAYSWFNHLRSTDDAPERAKARAGSLPVEKLIKAHFARHPRDLTKTGKCTLALSSRKWLRDVPCQRCTGEGRRRCSRCGHKTEPPATKVVQGKKAVITEREIVKELKPVTRFPDVTVEGTWYVPDGIPGVEPVKQKIKETHYVPEYYPVYECYQCRDTRWEQCGDCQGRGSAIRAYRPGATVTTSHERSISGSAPAFLVLHADEILDLPRPSWQPARPASCAASIVRELPYWRVALTTGTTALTPRGAFIGAGGRFFFQGCCDEIAGAVCDNKSLRGSAPVEWLLIAGFPAASGDAVSPGMYRRLHQATEVKRNILLRMVLGLLFLLGCLIVIGTSLPRSPS